MTKLLHDILHASQSPISTIYGRVNAVNSVIMEIAVGWILVRFDLHAEIKKNVRTKVLFNQI